MLAMTAHVAIPEPMEVLDRFLLIRDQLEACDVTSDRRRFTLEVIGRLFVSQNLYKTVYRPNSIH